MAAALGNQYAAKERVWTAAINRALDRRKAKDTQLKAIDELADALLDKCGDKDLAALKELGDRLEGKATQAIVGEGGGPLVVEIVKYAAHSTAG